MSKQHVMNYPVVTGDGERMVLVCSCGWSTEDRKKNGWFQGEAHLAGRWVEHARDNEGNNMSEQDRNDLSRLLDATVIGYDFNGFDALRVSLDNGVDLRIGGDGGEGFHVWVEQATT